MWSLPRRRPDEEIVVRAGKPKDADDAVGRYLRFTNLALACKLEIVDTEGVTIRLRGRPKNVERFRHQHLALQVCDLV